MRRTSLGLVPALLLACASDAPSATPRTDAGGDVPVEDVTAPADVEEPLFDPGPPRTVNVGGAADGTSCAADVDCLHGVCVQGPGLEPRCSVRCRSSADCADQGADTHCALDRAPTETRLACARSRNAEAGSSLAPCVVDEDCRSARCMDGVCAGACASDGDCPPGLRCGNVDMGGPHLALCRVAPITGVTVERYSIFDGEIEGNAPTAARRVYVPADAVSATWTTHDTSGAELYAVVSSLVSPSEERVVDLATWSPLRAQPLRTNPARLQFNTAMVAANDGVTLEPGVWTSTHLLTNFGRAAAPAEPRRMSAAFILKRAPGGVAAEGWTLRLRLVFVGTRDVSAATAPTNARLAAAVAAMQRIYRAAGVDVRVAGYGDVEGDDAERLAMIDGRGELDDLFNRPVDGDDVLTIYFVRGISSTAGLEGAIGIAGAILGPPGVGETVQSGVVVGWETTLGRTDQLGFTMAHESGHYLGLSHTRERLAGCTATVTTDCSSWGGVDQIDDTPTPASQAMRYLMYWLAVGGNELISPTQALVMRRNPMVH